MSRKRRWSKEARRGTENIGRSITAYKTLQKKATKKSEKESNSPILNESLISLEVEVIIDLINLESPEDRIF
jgi:hypothetical protein